MMLGTVVFGSIIGLLLGRAKIRRRLVPKALAEIFIYVTRCVPSIVMLFLVYYGLSEFLLSFGIDINRAGKGFFVITTFTILFSAGFGEVFRAAYLAVDAGQREAALSVGLTEWQAFYRVMLPQSVVIALPNFANLLVSLMKEGSLAYTIGLIDIMGEGQLIIGYNHGSYVLETYLALTILYWGLTVIIEKSFSLIEKRYFKGRKTA
jgi:L-cystine transport system permease protein